ncbi:MAG: T9SS type A sorting domain-containing protein [Bacteroidales bacterium]|nr:T9SS type A sorting domain-containing protein [Bacteroidales bacterium]
MKRINTVIFYLVVIMVNLNAQTVTDYDGNVYNTVQIGKQTWMRENLKTTHYSDGSVIPYIPDPVEWSLLSTGAYSIYNNDSSTIETYGYLYNWYAVIDENNICPAGWHVPLDADWTILETYLEGREVAGGKLKEAGISHWEDPNTNATNESGFTALPGGLRFPDGVFYSIGRRGFFWSSTKNTEIYAWLRYMECTSESIFKTNYDKHNGLSVRCIKDKELTVNLDSGLIAHYPFNGDANDLSGNNIHGETHETTLTADRFGYENRAFGFIYNSFISGSDENDNLPAEGDPRTIAAWIKPINATVFNEKTIYTYGNLSYRFQLYLDNYGKPAIGFDNTSSFNSGDSAIKDSIWTHIAGVYEGPLTSYYRIYMNGKESAAPKYCSGLPLCNRPFTWNIAHDQFAGDEYRGFLDDVRIYNRVLNSLEIEALFSDTMSYVTSIRPDFSNCNKETEFSCQFINSDYITIKTDLVNEYLVTIYSLDGIQIIQKLFYDREITIDISSVATGVYIIKVTNSQGVSTGKFIKQ